MRNPFTARINLWFDPHYTFVISGQRFGSGHGEREASMTRLMPFEPLPASGLFGFLFVVIIVHAFGCLAGTGNSR